MNTFRIGDYIRLNAVTESDKFHKRYVGEIGIYQGTDESNANRSLVRFDDFSLYIVDTDSLSLEKPADLDSIFKAFAEDNDGYEEFRDAIKDFYENK